MFTCALTSVQFLLLNQIPATFLGSVSLVYSIFLLLEDKLSFVRTKYFTMGVLTFQTIGYFVINGFTLSWSLLALSGTILGSLALWFEDPLRLKMTMLVTGLIWLAFQLSTGAYGQLPGEMIFLTGVIFSLTMLFKARRNGTPLANVEELPTLIRRKLSERKNLIVSKELII